ncbi:hypothetical protein F6455_14460 [Proteobacteria bacterium 005FR1]|nr:hypothetical protein [Proteobacteria bacterium 005FR1]
MSIIVRSLSLLALLGAAAGQAQPTTSEQPRNDVITQLDTVTGAESSRDFLGREIALRNLQVTRMAGERSFYVCGTSGEYDFESRCTSDEVLVVLAEDPGKQGTPVEKAGRLTIDRGRVTSWQQEGGKASGMDLAREEQALAADQEYFIIADSLSQTTQTDSADAAEITRSRQVEKAAAGQFTPDEDADSDRQESTQ